MRMKMVVVEEIKVEKEREERERLAS